MRDPNPHDSTRQHILDATRTALIRDGYERITTRQIAAEADVNIATVHYYFGTKEALLSEAIRDTFDQIDRTMRDAIARAPSATEALNRLFLLGWQIVREHTSILRYDLVIRGFRDPDARRSADTIYGNYRRIAQRILESHLADGGTLRGGLSPVTLAHFLVGASDGIILQYLVTGDTDQAQESLSYLYGHALATMGLAEEPQ